MQSRVVNGIKRSLAAAFAAVMLFSTAVLPVGAETAAEKYKRLKGELEAINGKIEKTKDDKSSAEQRKAAFVQQKQVLDQLIEVNLQDISETEHNLEVKEGEVAQKREELYKTDELFQERVEAIYYMNDANVLASMLNVDSFSELIMVTDALQRISKNDTDLLKKLAKQRKALEQEQAEIDQMLESLQQKYDQLSKDAEALAGSIAATNAAITQAEAALQAQEKIKVETQEALEQAQAEMAAIASKMGGSRNGDGSEYVGGVFVWPVEGFYRISCHYGAPDPNGRGHRGMDIAGTGIHGASIRACGKGTVLYATYAHSSYGNYVVIDHGNGVKTLYAHCNSLSVKAGTPVEQGDIIGTVGSTGFSTGPHLHLEVHDPGLQNPLKYLKG